MKHVYGEQGYGAAYDVEIKRQSVERTAAAEQHYLEMAQMAADREFNLSPLDVEYPTEELA